MSVQYIMYCILYLKGPYTVHLVRSLRSRLIAATFLRGSLHVGTIYNVLYSVSYRPLNGPFSAFLKISTHLKERTKYTV